MLKAKVKELKATIREMQSGRHDILLKGKSQQDATFMMQHAMNDKCFLGEQMQKKDPTGTLSKFWEEQRARHAILRKPSAAGGTPLY